MMLARYPKPMVRLLCRMGLLALLAPPMAKPLLSHLTASAFAGDGDACCRPEIVPELLALADWPLDKESPQAGPSADSAIAGAELEGPIEIVGSAPIPTVMAAGYESPGDPGKTAAPATGVALGRRQVALDDSALDGIRGGYEPPDSNLSFTFGIERAVYVNGQLVASTVLNLKDLQLVSGGGMATGVQAAIDPAGVLVVQNGTGNAFQIQMAPNSFGTVIQNTLDNQKIQSITTINAAVNTAQALRAMALQSAIQDGVVSSLRR